MWLADRDKYKRPNTRGAAVMAVLFVMLLCPVLAIGQKPEYEFYFEFRTVFSQKLQEENHWSLAKEQVFERYAAKLKSDGIGESEIARRLGLLRTEHAALEADFYSRLYLDDNSNFNHAPNRFLMEMVQGRQPGAALDYGMGQGRNSIYLASLGWQVWGFDPAEAGVAVAQKQAKALGLTLHTSAVRDMEYDFGKERFDLVLFSWTMPLVAVQKVADSLRPDGIVVMECGTDFLPSRNAMLHLFDPLVIEHYEIVRDKSDWEGRREVDIIRLVARKP
jgi:2-polyprenyl-3-methyl-5-hydroxy-6-metoxy-1,4-benzoquinol methylase